MKVLQNSSEGTKKLFATAKENGTLESAQSTACPDGIGKGYSVNVSLQRIQANTFNKETTFKCVGTVNDERATTLNGKDITFGSPEISKVADMDTGTGLKVVATEFDIAPGKLYWRADLSKIKKASKSKPQPEDDEE